MSIQGKFAPLAAAVALMLGAAMPAVRASPTPLFEATYETVGGGFGSDTIYGVSFTMTQTVVATALGLYDYMSDGFGDNHDVGLFNAAGTLLASVSFGPGQAGTAGGGAGAVPGWTFAMRYLDIAELTLQAGETYTLAALFGRGSGDGVALAKGSTTSAYAGGFGAAWGWGPGLAKPANTLAPYVDTVGIDLLVRGADSGSAANDVPEPGSLALAGVALFALVTALRRRR